jgi:hypothetical protein
MESLFAFVFFKILKLHDLKYKRSLEISEHIKSGSWFVNFSELKNMLGDNSERNVEALDETAKILHRKFTILGCDLDYDGCEINWHLDPQSNFEWDRKYYKRLYPVSNSSDNTDCKMPWELSRFQHLLFLIKGHYISGSNEYVEEPVRQVSNWIDENPLCYGINWTCTIEVAIRVCNWIWAWWAFKDHPAWTEEFNEKFLKSIWQHGWYIERNLEDKGGVRTNHYLSNIVGLIFIGIMFPQFRETEKWKNFGVKELIRCMEEMVCPDGVSFESSTAYHRLVLELFTYSAILCKRNDIVLPAPFWKQLEKMFDLVMYCMGPDDRMPMVGDSDDGRFFILSNYFDWDRWDFRYLLAIGASLFNRGDLKAKAGDYSEKAFLVLGQEGKQTFDRIDDAKVSPASRAFKEGGFYILENDQMKAIVRFAPLYKDLFAWHAHCDTFSFILYVKGYSIIVDPGTYNYTGKPKWRNEFRSTECHNTIRIDKREMFEMPENDIFLLKSSEKPPKLLEWQVTDEQTIFEGEHYWYSTTKNSIIHRRKFVLDNRQESLIITDSIISEEHHMVEYFLHFHPDIRPNLQDDDLLFYTEHEGYICRIGFDNVESLEIIDGWYSEKYNIKKPTTGLLSIPAANALTTTITT